MQVRKRFPPPRFTTRTRGCPFARPRISSSRLVRRSSTEGKVPLFDRSFLYPRRGVTKRHGLHVNRLSTRRDDIQFKFTRRGPRAPLRSKKLAVSSDHSDATRDRERDVILQIHASRFSSVGDLANERITTRQIRGVSLDTVDHQVFLHFCRACTSAHRTKASGDLNFVNLSKNKKSKRRKKNTTGFLPRHKLYSPAFRNGNTEPSERLLPRFVSKRSIVRRTRFT